MANKLLRDVVFEGRHDIGRYGVGKTSDDTSISAGFRHGLGGCVNIRLVPATPGQLRMCKTRFAKHLYLDMRFFCSNRERLCCFGFRDIHEKLEPP